MTALLAPKRKSEARPPRWSLREVRLPQRRMASVPFILSLGVLLALGMIGLLLLNTALQEQAFAVRDQQKTATQLGYRVAALETEVTEARSSTRLAIEASKLGMVPNPYPAYLSLPAGDVIGNPTTMTGREVPEIRYRTPEELEAIAKAREEAMAKAKADAEAKAKAREEAKAKAAEEARKKAAEAKKKAEAEAKKKAETKKKAEAEAKNKQGKKKEEGDR